MSRSAALALAAALIGFALPAHADERITDFASDIRVAQTGALTVTETISVNSEGAAIRHGIFRDFPTIYNKQGRYVHVGFDVLSVSLDGHDEPYTVARIEDGERVKIGDAKIELPPGPHRFVLTYATDRQIGFYPNFDELYWNVTGNFWPFPIDRAEATIELPGNARILQYSLYTGAAGSTAQNAQAGKISDTAMRFSTTAPLGPNEGLTVAVGFSKGAVLPPSSEELRLDFIRDNAATIVAAAGVLLMTIYFIIVWIEHGQRPARGTIIPLFAPPKNFSPAAIRFVHSMGYDRKAYAAALVDMAVKGFLKITEDHGAYSLTRTRQTEMQAPLSSGEALLAAKLFADGDTIELKQANHTAIAQSISALRASLKKEYERVYFVTNSHWFIGGIVMLALTGVASVALSDDPRPLPVIIALSLGCIFAYAFYRLLKHPTLLGAKIMDEIDGFKLFLATAEKDRLEILNPPNVTPAVFEKFLPYAIALDCENQWSRKFEAEAAAAGITPDAQGGYYTPAWYSGSSFDQLGTAGFAGALGASMASAVASASSAPGSDGGGGSGGGGGGGGGGGW